MKSWYILILWLLLWWSLWWYKGYQEKKIGQHFDNVVSSSTQKMNVYKQLDLTFLPQDLSTIDLETKKDSALYLNWLQAEFQEAVQVYSSAHHPRTRSWLPKELEIDGLINSMSLEEKIAQLFIFWYDGTILSPWEKSFLLDYQPGGVIVMWKNVSPSLAQTLDDMQSTQDLAPLFVAIDQEWWLVARIDENLAWQPDVSLNELCEVYTNRSNILHQLGINMNFWIVADVTNDPNSFIYPRVFQWDSWAKVAEAVRCTMTSLSTLKHFPWHGGTTLDTHEGTAQLTKDETSRKQADLLPFTSGISADADLVMMWHLIADFIDPDLPATLSRSHHEFLRSLDFSWLTVTDDMLMISGNGARDTQLEQTLSAGTDLILYVDASTIGKTNILDHARDFVENGGISEEDLDQRVRRILEKKQKIISRDDYVPLELVKPRMP